jgi:hypothetical protein
MESESARRGRVSRLKLFRGVVYRSFNKLLEGLRGACSDHPLIDVCVSALVVAAHALVVLRYGLGDVLAQADGNQRTDTYAAGAGVSALIGGFTGTAIAQYGSSSGPIITWLRAVHGAKIRRNWLSISRWLMVVAVLCVASMAIDGGSRPNGSNWLFELAFMIAIMKFARLVYLFELIITAVDRQDENALAIQKANKRYARVTAGRASAPQDPGIDYDDEG